MQRRVSLFEAPEGILFTLKDVTYTPEMPRMKEPFTVRGKVELFGLPFLAPVWVIAKVTFPEKWWEEIIPIIGSPTVGEGQMAIGGDFEISFPKGFDRDGEFTLDVEAHAGPTYTVDKITLPPFPPMAKETTTFIVSGEVAISFRLVKPTVSPATTVEPGTDITISCPVTSECTREQDIKVKCIVYEGSILPGHGAKLAEYTSGVTPIAPGETKKFEFSRRTVAGTIDRRDVEVEVYIAGEVVKESEWDDVYYVGKPEERIDFDLTKPTVTPSEIAPGTDITIRCPITSACTEEQTITVKCKIYEGSILPGHGRLIATKTSPPFSIAPDEGYDVSFPHTAVAGTIDRRDIEVEVYIAGRLVKESEWDDVYYVKAVELERLEVKIDPVGAGYVTTDPEPEGGTQHNWLFPYGTTVYVTAHPNAGYVFESWSGEMKDTTAITAPVYPMTEHRLITAHFKEGVPLDPPEVETLEAEDITHDSATLRGKLIETSYWSNVDVFFEWGKTTSYGKETPKIRMYEGDEGDKFYTELQHYLEPNTTYHFRAAVDAVGPRSDEVDTNYGRDKSFTTLKEKLGFTMRVENPPAGAVTWRAWYEDITYPWMKVNQPFSYVWEWDYENGTRLPDSKKRFWICADGPEEDGYRPTIQLDGILFRIIAGKDYEWDFAAHEMREL